MRKTYNGQIKTFRTQSTTVWHVSENGAIIKYFWKGFTSQRRVSSEGMDLFVQILRFCTKRVVISPSTFQIPPFNNCLSLRTLVWGTVKQQAARRETKRSPPFSFLLFSSLEAATSSGSSPISMRWVEHCWGWTIDNKCLIHSIGFCLSQVCHLAIYGDQSGQWPIWCVLYHNIVIFWISKPHVYNLCCRCDLVTYLSHLLLVTSSSSNIVIYCWKVRTHCLNLSFL